MKKYQTRKRVRQLARLANLYPVYFLHQFVMEYDNAEAQSALTPDDGFHSLLGQQEKRQDPEQEERRPSRRRRAVEAGSNLL